ncbi:MAG: RDD family protein [Brevundimonas sp.]
MSSVPMGPIGDPDDERPVAPAVWRPTPTVPFPRPAPLEPLPIDHAAFERAGDRRLRRFGRRAARPAATGGPLYGSWRRRTVGALVDVLVMTVPLLIALAYDDPQVLALGGTWFLGWFVGNRVLSQGSAGLTFGRFVTGTRLRRTSDAAPPGVRAALVRELAHVVDLVTLVGFARPLWNRRRRTFADSICGTTVEVER